MCIQSHQFPARNEINAAQNSDTLDNRSKAAKASIRLAFLDRSGNSYFNGSSLKGFSVSGVTICGVTTFERG